MIVRMMKVLITLLGAGAGAALAAVLTPLFSRLWPDVFGHTRWVAVLYTGLSLLLALVFFLLSGWIIDRTMRAAVTIERRWSKLSTRQIFMTSAGLVTGLIIAALLTQLILTAGPSLLTVSLSALTYVVLGFIGMRLGYSRSRKQRNRKQEPMLLQMADDFMDGEILADEEDVEAAFTSRQTPTSAAASRKLLDTSVIIDGRIADIVHTGFLEGEIVIPGFVLAELRHIADSADNLRRARGRRGLDVLNRLQKQEGCTVTVDDTDYADVEEVDVKLLRLCRDKGGVVVTNDYNLNKVAGVTGIRVLNINDLANAVKPMLIAGEELNVQVVREGKEPGQGVSYLDDGTMIVIENGKRFVGEQIPVVVTTVLQTSAGRMIFARLKAADEAKVG
ncbi:MAG: hypothetical protein E7319_07730 [Clostridiales bacterium]|nr:hypothetical protein [Clostridiales bacterium]